MVWLPDLHPASVVALNARALQEIFSDNRQRVRQGRAVLNALVQNRLAVEEKFRTWRPADFADALRRWPPAQRKTLRRKWTGWRSFCCRIRFLTKSTSCDTHRCR